MRTARAGIAALLMSMALSAAAAPTSVDVHVLARDAKFVGSGVGGMQVVISDAVTGEVLAQGVTEGGTGDTDLIMGQRKHGTALVTDGAAGFSASVDLDAPRKVTVRAFGPLGYPESANSVSATEWLLPGKSAGEQGWVLELPGLIVDVHDTPTLVAAADGGAPLTVHAKVRMMCGCPLTPGGLWDSKAFQIGAAVMKDGVEVASTVLDYAGEASEFQGALQISRPGIYRLVIRAHQPRTGNTGVVSRTLVVN